MELLFCEQLRIDQPVNALIVLGLLILAGSGLLFRYAYEVSRFQERLDAIGSTTPWHAVEPAEWRVFLMQIMATVLAAFGVMVFIAGF